MTNGTARASATVRKVIAGILGAAGLFIMSVGIGVPSWSVVAVGAALVLVAIGLVTIQAVRGGERGWMSASAHVIAAPPAPANQQYGRAELDLVVTGPGLPTVAVKIREPKVPVDRWPVPGTALPVLVAVDDRRNVRVQWDDAPRAGAAGAGATFGAGPARAGAAGYDAGAAPDPGAGRGAAGAARAPGTGGVSGAAGASGAAGGVAAGAASAAAPVAGNGEPAAGPVPRVRPAATDYDLPTAATAYHQPAGTGGYDSPTAGRPVAGRPPAPAARRGPGDGRPPGDPDGPAAPGAPAGNTAATAADDGAASAAAGPRPTPAPRPRTGSGPAAIAAAVPAAAAIAATPAPRRPDTDRPEPPAGRPGPITAGSASASGGAPTPAADDAPAGGAAVAATGAATPPAGRGTVDDRAAADTPDHAATGGPGTTDTANAADQADPDDFGGRREVPPVRAVAVPVARRPESTPVPRPRVSTAGPVAGTAEVATSYSAARPAAAGPVHGVGATLVVRDLDRAVDFYCRVLDFAMIDRGGDTAIVAAGDTRLILRAGADGDVPRHHVHLNLEVGDIDASHEALRAAGVRFTAPPRPISTGRRLQLWAATFRDPDGHGLALTQWRVAPSAEDGAPDPQDVPPHEAEQDAQRPQRPVQ
ncbi:hypothetical protein GCM10010123_00040 [Pilimelia anulata]|uniref:VOC domain-containing protein n=1 Tax=Pilimelia anulata TaxID=53371 RepID=A0A8J3B5W5_9ACTN|nr:VOC family protein [Pilimelia anulata]GGJ74099.1 hypothetical protein GCM10010123_00040 [Pilimelia anulata]